MLDLNSNNLKVLPASMRNLTKLKKLNLSNNDPSVDLFYMIDISGFFSPFVSIPLPPDSIIETNPFLSFQTHCQHQFKFSWWIPVSCKGNHQITKWSWFVSEKPGPPSRKYWFLFLIDFLLSNHRCENKSDCKFRKKSGFNLFGRVEEHAQGSSWLDQVPAKAQKF